MTNRNMNFYLEGTSALDMRASAALNGHGKIIEFPAVRAKRPAHIEARNERLSAREAVRNVLESSEMYCSLRNESMRGCAYGLFTKQGVAALACASSAIGVLALVFGA